MSGKLKPSIDTDRAPESSPVLKNIKSTLMDAFGFDFKIPEQGKGFYILSAGTLEPVVGMSLNGRTLVGYEAEKVSEELWITPSTTISKDGESYVITVPSPSLRTLKIRISAKKSPQ